MYRKSDPIHTCQAMSLVSIEHKSSSESVKVVESVSVSQLSALISRRLKPKA